MKAHTLLGPGASSSLRSPLTVPFPPGSPHAGLELRQAALPKTTLPGAHGWLVPPEPHTPHSLCRSRSFQSRTRARSSMVPPPAWLCLPPSSSNSPEKQPGPLPLGTAMTSRSSGPVAGCRPPPRSAQPPGHPHPGRPVGRGPCGHCAADPEGVRQRGAFSGPGPGEGQQPSPWKTGGLRVRSR